MATWKARHIQQQAARVYRTLGSPALRHQDIMERFATSHQLTYFSPALPPSLLEAIDEVRTRGTHGLCMGVHANYMTSTYSLMATARHPNFAITEKGWLETHVELRTVTQLPFIYIGTRQQTKTQYAELLTRYPTAQYLHIACPPSLDKRFHERYAVLAAVEDVEYVKRLFTDDVIEALVTRHETVAFHLEDRQIIAITELRKPRVQAVDRLFHAAIWMAKTVDDRFGMDQDNKTTAM